jgi:hypothetical protein
MRTTLGRLLQVWIVLPVLFGLSMLAAYPFRFVFEFDSDEGTNLMKALLQLKGYVLYTDIYSDQPPLFTYYLNLLFRLGEPNVTLARLGVLVFSLLLLGAAIWYLRRIWGFPHALAGFFLLILLPRYPRLSVSVMIGLPAVALALAAFAFSVHWHLTRSLISLAGSALLMAAAVLTKAFVAPFGVILGLGILVSALTAPSQDRPQKPVFRSLLLWTAISGGTLILAAAVIGPDQWGQLSSTHVDSGSLEYFVKRAETLNIHTFLRDAWGVVVLGVAGTLWAFRRKEWTAPILAMWALVSYIALSRLIPVWYHHHFIVTVPAAILAAIAVGETSSRCFNGISAQGVTKPVNLLTFILLLGMLWTQSSRVPPFLRHMDPRIPNLIRHPESHSLEFDLLARIVDLGNQSETLVTDRPMFAFRMGKTVPPQLAVFTDKRVQTGSLAEGDVIQAIGEHQPDQVLLARFELPGVEAWLEHDYSLEYDYAGFHLYQRLSSR